MFSFPLLCVCLSICLCLFLCIYLQVWLTPSLQTAGLSGPTDQLTISFPPSLWQITFMYDIRVWSSPFHPSTFPILALFLLLHLAGHHSEGPFIFFFSVAHIERVSYWTGLTGCSAGGSGMHSHDLALSWRNTTLWLDVHDATGAVVSCCLCFHLN